MIDHAVSFIQKLIYTTILLAIIFGCPLVRVYSFGNSEPKYKNYLEYIYYFLFIISLILAFNTTIRNIQQYSFFNNIINTFSKPFWIFALVFYTVYLLENEVISKNTLATIIDILCIILCIIVIFDVPFISKLLTAPSSSGINTQWFILCILCATDILITLLHPLLSFL